jgi:hypothetical protein
MKNSIKISRIFTEVRETVRDQLIRLDDLSLSSLLQRFSFKIVSLSLRRSKKLAPRIRLYHKFALYLYSLNRRHGSVYVVKYLKACSLAISKAIAGTPFKSLREIEPDLPLPRLSKSGFPIIIGTRDRRSLGARDNKVIRMYLSLFNLYRVITVECKSNLETIWGNFTGDSLALNMYGSWFRRNSKQVIGRYLSNRSIAAHNFMFLETASVSSKKSWTSALYDACVIAEDRQMYSHFQDYCSATNSTILDWINRISREISVADFSLGKPFKLSYIKNRVNGDYLGQLSLKDEPAGKQRVFAIVDGWTQSLLTPLHDYLFDILKKLPNDGTMDQGASYDRACAKAVKYNCSYGYDLSAATDRLPIKLQVDILSSLIGMKAAVAWRNVLVDRSYLLEDQAYRYVVGQPMGAKSSFAMLGLCHHMIMQYISHSLGNKGWEERYEITGDDIVIFCKDLADAYLTFMKRIGVPINEKKSVVAEGRPVLEYLKRTFAFGHDVSPLSFKQFFSQDTFKGRISTIIGLYNKDKSFTDKPILVADMVLRSALWDLRPKQDSVALLALMNCYMNTRDHIYVNYFLKLVKYTEPMINRSKMLFANFNYDLAINALSAMIKGRKLPSVGRDRDANFIMFKWCVKESIRCQIQNHLDKYDDLWLEEKIRVHQEFFFSFLPRDKRPKLNQLVRSLLFCQKAPYVDLINEFVLNDPTTSLEELLVIYDKLLGNLGRFTYVERIKDASNKVPSINLDTCGILRLVTKGYWYRVIPGHPEFDFARFSKFAEKSINWKDLREIKNWADAGVEQDQLIHTAPNYVRGIIDQSKIVWL